jgi:hypothetical protein
MRFTRNAETRMLMTSKSKKEDERDEETKHSDETMATDKQQLVINEEVGTVKFIRFAIFQRIYTMMNYYSSSLIVSYVKGLVKVRMRRHGLPLQSEKCRRLECRGHSKNTSLDKQTFSEFATLNLGIKVHILHSQEENALYTKVWTHTVKLSQQR